MLVHVITTEGEGRVKYIYGVDLRNCALTKTNKQTGCDFRKYEFSKTNTELDSATKCGWGRGGEGHNYAHSRTFDRNTSRGSLISKKIAKHRNLTGKILRNSILLLTNFTIAKLAPKYFSYLRLRRYENEVLNEISEPHWVFTPSDSLHFGSWFIECVWCSQPHKSVSECYYVDQVQTREDQPSWVRIAFLEKI